MWLLPFESFTLISRMRPIELEKKLQENIDAPRKFLSFTPATKPYRGQFSQDGFDIERVIDYRNSFVPVIKGKITSNYVEQEIHITMRPSIFVLVFMTVWLGITGFVGLIMAVMLFKEGFQGIMAVVPIGMFFFGYGMLIFGFRTEAKKSKKFLIELFKADIK